MAKGKLGRMSQLSRALEPFSSSSRTRTLSVVITIDSRAEWIGLFALCVRRTDGKWSVKKRVDMPAI